MRVGGTTAAAGNVISGNGGRYGFGGGVYVNQATDTVIQGTLIGTDVTGTRALGNGGAGVYFDHAYPALVGGAEPGAGNVIAYNESPGVAGDRGIQITVRRNSIFANGDNVENYNGFYGIHFDQYNVQQLPELTFAGAEGDGTRVKGGLYTPLYSGSVFPTSVVFEFFRRSACLGDEFGQGEAFVGDLEAPFDATGLVTFSVLLPVRLEPGEVLTATATGADGSTSYFSRCLGDTHGCDLPFVRFVTRDLSVPVGDPVTVAVEVSGSAPVAYQWYRIEEGTSTPIPGATASSYTPPDGYTSLKVVATNACGNAVAYPLVWRCSVPPAFLEQPQSATIPAGTSVQLTMSLAVSEFARVQWYQGRSGDTSTPVRSRSNEFLPPPLTETTSYWVRATNGCGTVDSETATLRVVAPMEITSVEIKGAGAKAKIVAKGRNIGGNVVVYVEGNGFTRAAKVSGSKITQRGPAAGGATIDDLIPPGATVRIDFISDERGYVQVEYTRPR
jgi:hypothetical protein